MNYLRLPASSILNLITLTSNVNQLENIFRVRNEISHEMDIDFVQSTRNRRQRKRKEMYDYTNEIFRISEAFLKEVDNKLQKIA